MGCVFNPPCIGRGKSINESCIHYRKKKMPLHYLGVKYIFFKTDEDKQVH